MIVRFLAEVYGYQDGQVVDLRDEEEALYVVESGYAEWATEADLEAPVESPKRKKK